MGFDIGGEFLGNGGYWPELCGDDVSEEENGEKPGGVDTADNGVAEASGSFDGTQTCSGTEGCRVDGHTME